MSNKIAETGFWLDLTGHAADDFLIKELVSFFKGYSVVDLGCGPCYYLRCLRDAGIGCDGYDGNPMTPPDGHIIDLSQPVDLGKQYDWVLSLEVGEHIPAQYEQNFINNIHNHNRFGAVVSWAIEDQGGQGHVNERNNDYIKSIFADLGYLNDTNQEDRFREVATFSWFKNTIMVFRKDAWNI
jgi:hypothetical protein